MAYIGDKPSQTLASPTSQYFNGDGSTVAFTLNRSVNVAEDLEVFVNNIQQEPGVGKSYTATGTALTFDAAPSAGTANVYVVYRGLAEVTTRLEHDPNAALAATTGTFSGDLTVDTDTLYVDSTNNNVGIGTTSPSSLYSGANNLVVGGGSGANGMSIFSGTTDAGRIYFADGTSGAARYAGYVEYGHSNNGMLFGTNGSTRMTIDSSGRVTMPYQPAFTAYLTATTSKASGTSLVPGTFGTKLNVGGHYSTSTKRFTAPVAGLYLFTGTVATEGGAGSFDYLSCEFWVNGSRTFIGGWQGSASPSYSKSVSSVVLSLSASDYVELACETSKTFNMQGGSSTYTYFNGCLLG